MLFETDDVVTVDYPDNFQVIIDRQEEGEIEIRLWYIGDDNPLAKLRFQYAFCKGCNRCFDEPDINEAGFCENCLMPDTPEPSKTDVIGLLNTAISEVCDDDQQQAISEAYSKLLSREFSDKAQPYTPAELESMKNFAAGYMRAVSDEHLPVKFLNTWDALPDYPNIDIHFMWDENTGALGAWGYRRDKVIEGDCHDEIKIF